MKGLIIIVFGLCLLPLAASRANDQPKTLDSLIDRALRHNPDIKAAGFVEQSAQFSAKAAGRLPDPKLMLAALNLPRRSLALDETPMSGIVIGFSQTIPWPAKLNSRSKIARMKSDFESQVTVSQINNVVRMVTHNYFEYSYWTLVEKIINKNLQLTQLLADVAETKYANGLGTAQDFLRARTMLARLENRRQLISRQRLAAVYQLRWLVNDPDMTTDDIAADLPLEIQQALISEDGVSLDNNPRIAAASIKTGIASGKLSLSKADYWPDITLGVDYRIREDVPMDAVHGEDFITARLGLKLPLWFFAKQNNSTRAARLTLNAAREKESSLKKQLDQHLADVQTTLITIYESLAMYEKAILPQAQAAFDAARIAYEVGRVDFHNLLSAQMELLDLEIEQLQFVKQYHQKSAELIELTGRKYGDIK